MLAPEVFELDDIDGHAHVRDETVSGVLGQQVREAARSCPEQAIIVGEDGATETAPNGAIR
jgi:ferredoxin